MTREEVAAAEADEALARRMQEEEMLTVQDGDRQHEQERQRLLQEQKHEQRQEQQLEQEKQREREQLQVQQQQQQRKHADEVGKDVEYMALLGSPAEVYNAQFGE